MTPFKSFQPTAAGSVTILLGLSSVGVMALQSIALDGGVNMPLFATIVAVVLSLVLLDQWRFHTYGEYTPQTVGMAILLIHFVLVEAIALWDGLTYTSILYLTLPFPAFFMLGRKAGYAVTAALLIWLSAKFFIFKPNWLDDPTTVNSFALLFVSAALITAMAQAVTGERTARQRTEQLLADLERSHQQLATYAEKVAELAVVDERNRLARDIHDSIGHYLTVIGIQLQKGMLIFHDSPDEALVSIGNAARTADQALDDVRVSVGTLRGSLPPFSLRQALGEMAYSLRDLPFEVALNVTGNEANYNRQQLITLFRGAQEGVTNVQRHACAQRVSIQVRLDSMQADCLIRDDGVGLSSEHPLLHGNGLRGLRERLELVNGELRVSGAPGKGTTLRLTIPNAGGTV